MLVGSAAGWGGEGSSVATSTIALLLALGAAVVGAGALWWWAGRHRDAGGHRRLGTDAVVPIAVVLLALLVAQVVGAVALGFTFWSLLSVVYLDLVVALPLLAAVVLATAVAGRAGRGAVRVTGPVIALGAVAVLAAPLGWWTSHIGPYRLRLDTASLELPAERGGDDVVRVGVVSDIQTTHVGAHERAAVAELMAQEPDVVLVAGDVFQGSASQLAANRDALRGLFGQMAEAPGGVFVVVGDVDTEAGLVDLLAGTPATLLVDEVADIEVGDRTLALGGVSLEPTPAGRAVIDELASRPADQVRILLAHRPDWVFLSPGGVVDVVVSGHTHGGQVALPGIGPLMTMSDVPRPVAAGGLHAVGGTDVYVSTGVGREQQGAPQIRFLVDPSVAVVELR